MCARERETVLQNGIFFYRSAVAFNICLTIRLAVLHAVAEILNRFRRLFLFKITVFDKFFIVFKGVLKC